jgi:polygalacturonase
LVENCHYGTTHGCMTLGSESVTDWNVIMRNCRADNTNNVLWLKMRPDTPQRYQHVRIENFIGKCRNFLLVRPWTQFYEKQERQDMPLSECSNMTFRNIRMTCNVFFNVTGSDKYALRNFDFEDIDCSDYGKEKPFSKRPVEGLTLKNVKINGEMIE